MDSTNLSPEFLEKIAEYACKYFSECVPKQGKPLVEKIEWTTMACIIQTDENNAMKIIAVGTGTKCLGQNELSSNGDLVSDSHAEVIARRSFQLYLYDQVEKAILQKHSILKITKNEDGTGFCELCHGVNFHLFVSHLPCGDAAIFDIVDSKPASESDDDVPAKKLKLEVHRTGAKLAERLYEDVQCVGKCRIKPGKGDPTLSMSCSDKIAKWQILGLQGSLLGNFIPEPIVLSAVIIGGSVEFNTEALERAIHTRFHSKLPEEIRKDHHLPVVHQSRMNFMEFPQDGKPAPASISGCLSHGSFSVEVSVNGRKQGATKKNFGKPSARVRICRKNLLKRFLNLIRTFEEHGFSSSVKTSPDGTYSEVKKLNKDYIQRWLNLKQEVMLGWTVKPDNLQNFTAND